MGLHFYEDDGCIKPAKGRVICIEYDGDISCFELGDLPPQPEDPRELGIVFPCCVKNKKPLSKKDSAILKVRKPDKKQGKGVSYSDKKTSSVSSEECSFPPKNINRNQDCILYVFDKNGFNKAISYAKANINCKNTAGLKGGKCGQKNRTSDNRNERMYSVSLNPGKSLHGCKSRELRGGILSTDCFCLRRNGLQYDCRRTGCQNSPLCSVLPAPVCEPSQVACITHCANPHAEELSRICKLRPW